jgi:hypothetical protein
MAGLGLWDLVAPYFLLGVSPSEGQAALAALEVDDFESSSDELGAVIRGRARFAAGSDVYVDPVARAFGTGGGHPRDDPTRRDPWIDLAEEPD